jgi:hypothetical protein
MVLSWASFEVILMSAGLPSNSWFYKQNGQVIGPLAAAQLQEQLTLGLLRPDQIVWHQRSESLLFVRAGTVARTPTRLQAIPA